MIRSAEPRDVPDLLRLIRELAAFEREPTAVAASEDDLHRALFPTHGTPTTFAHVTEVDSEDGSPRVVGMAIWFLSFSTWTGKNGIWLEDLFIEPEYRGSGLGKELLVELARECVRRGLPRLEWWVLDWNTASIEFYTARGAVAQHEWTTYRIAGDALARLGG